MSQLRNLTPYTERHLVATSSTVQYEWFTGWQPTEGIDNIRAVLKAKNAGNSLEWQLVIQYAPVRADEPLAPLPLASSRTGTDEYQTGDVSVAGNMAANRLFRLGIVYFSHGGVEQGDLGLIASWKSIGTDLGRVRLNLSVVSQGVKYEPLTSWIPATFMSEIRAAFILNSITGTSNDLRYQLAYQTAGTSPQQPGPWVDAEPGGFVQPSGTYDERNTGDIAVNTSDMWFRLGVAYELSSGTGTNTTAVLDAALSCR